MVNDEFQKQPLWESNKRIKLDNIRLDCGDIVLTIQWYEQVHGIVESYLVYRLYCGQIPQVQIHTLIVHGNILTANFLGTKDKIRSARHKIQLLAEDENRI